MVEQPNEQFRILRWPEVSSITGFKSKCHVERLEKRGDFPKSIKIGVRAKGWLLSEIQEWMVVRIELRNSEVACGR
jgi:prophage regulatory protein